MRIAVALMTAVSISAFAMAQEPAPPFPVVSDLAEGWELGGQPMPVDVLGVKIGAPREEAQATALAGLEVDASLGELMESEVGIAANNGVQVVYRYASAYRIEKQTPAGKDTIWLKFTTGISGERVGSIERSISWSDLPDAERPRFADIEASLKEKYGEPSFVEGDGYYWIYLKAEKVTVAPGAQLFDTQPGTPEKCVEGAYDGQLYIGVGEDTTKQQAVKDCSLIVKANIQRDGRMTDLAFAMQLQIGGSSRWAENTTATNAFLEAELEKLLATEPAAGTAPPKL